MLKLLFAVAALSTTAPLAASERDISQVARIHHADLDLTSVAGKATLDRRIEGALRFLCAEDQQVALAKRLQEIRCRRAAMTQIAAQRSRVIANAVARAPAQRTALTEQPARSASETH